MVRISLVRAAAGLASTALFLGLLFFRIDMGEVVDSFAEADYAWIVPALLVHWLSTGFRALRWQRLLDPIRHIPLVELYKLTIIGYMANNLLPMRAGELLRVYLTGQRWQLSKMSTFGTVAVERVFDGMVLVFCLLTLSIFLDVNDLLRNFTLILAGVFATAFIIFMALVSWPGRAERLLDKALRIVPTRFRSRAQGWASSFLIGLQAIRKPKAQAFVLAATLTTWSLDAVAYSLVGRAFGIDEAFPVFLMVVAAANLGFTLPVSQGGIGPFEFFTREALVLAGVEASLATAYAVALHAILLVPFTLFGLYLLWSVEFSLKDVWRRPVTLSEDNVSDPQAPSSTIR
jgi:uncharacterized protein (TIRG00374 family)